MSIQHVDIPESFKMTALGLFPEEWKLVKLGEIATSFSGVWGDEPGDNSSEMKCPVRVIRVSDIKENSKIRYHQVPTRIVSEVQARKFALHPGNIIVVKSSGSKARVISGRCAYFDPEDGFGIFIPSNFTMALKVNSNQVVSEFVWFYLLTDQAVKAVHSMAEGSTYPNLKQTEYLTLPIPLPSLPEQKAIVQILSTVQKTIEAQDKIITAANELKKSLIHHLFTYGPVPFAESEKILLKETEIGLVPEHWQSNRLDAFFTLQRGFDLPNQNRLFGSIPILSSSGITGFHSEFKVHGPGVVTGRYGTLGQVFYVEQDFWPLNTTLFVKDFKGNDSRFIAVFLSTLHMGSFNDKTSVPGINRNVLHALRIAFPPLGEQQEIAGVLTVVNNKIQSEEKRKAALQTLFKTMLHNLMTGKVRVKDMEAGS
jgi:type I restriction enzyme S subunit